MMNIGGKPIFSDKGIVTSIGWEMDGKIDYVLEGNINYTGAVMKWIVEDLGLIESPKVAAEYAGKANAMQFQSDILSLPVLVPALEELSGIGPAYAAGMALGLYDKDTIFAKMTRTEFLPAMSKEMKAKKLNGWKKSIQMVVVLQICWRCVGAANGRPLFSDAQCAPLQNTTTGLMHYPNGYGGYRENIKKIEEGSRE